MAPSPSHESAGSDSPERIRAVRSRDGLRQLDAERLPDHQDRLFRAAYALCGSRDEAEDLVQDTYVRVLQRPRFLRRDDDLGYLLRVLRNTWINAYKARRSRPVTVEFDESTDFVIDPGADPGVTVTDIQTIYAALNELSDPLRETLVAVDVLGLSYRQAAHALRVRPGTIMSRLFRARNSVAEHLERVGERSPKKGPEA
jgi:RNA polymerase sigma-70 factor (ECF subfamily)